MLLLVSLLLRLVPGDPIDVMLGEGAVGAEREQLRSALGLDRPPWRRLGDFAVGVLHGDLGRSIVSGDPVGQLLLERYPATLELAGAALLIAMAIALPLGAGAAVRPGSFADRASLGLAVARPHCRRSASVRCCSSFSQLTSRADICRVCATSRAWSCRPCRSG